MKATAYSPGHITGFFETREHRDPLRSGSRGAGLCVDKGATTAVSAKKGSGRIDICINGARSLGPVTRSAVEFLLGRRELDLDISSVLELPVGEGFGMSAAGALSAAFAVASILERPAEEAWIAAHRAELENRTGLGDVAALSRGGVTFRRKEGLPPYGQIERLADELTIVTGVVGPAIKTSDVLSDPEKRKRVNVVGRECYSSLARSPSVKEFLRLSQEFTFRSGLATPQVTAAIGEIDGAGGAAMIMLGNAVFAVGELDAVEGILSSYGPTFRLGLDLQGPRLLALEERSLV
jgi:pantoate kinase